MAEWYRGDGTGTRLLGCTAEYRVTSWHYRLEHRDVGLPAEWSVAYGLQYDFYTRHWLEFEAVLTVDGVLKSPFIEQAPWFSRPHGILCGVLFYSAEVPRVEYADLDKPQWPPQAVRTSVQVHGQSSGPILHLPPPLWHQVEQVVAFETDLPGCAPMYADWLENVGWGERVEEIKGKFLKRS